MKGMVMAERDLRILETRLGTNESIRLCKTCKHSNYSPPPEEQPLESQSIFYKCTRLPKELELIQIDFVTGSHKVEERPTNKQHQRYCDVERNISTPTSCGERGRFWEPLTEDDQPT